MQPEDQMFALVPSRTDTVWFRTMREASRSAAFFYGRIKFKGADQGAPFPSVLFYFGDTPSRFWHRFSDVAWVVDTGGNR
jgi:hypothetical protein